MLCHVALQGSTLTACSPSPIPLNFDSFHQNVLPVGSVFSIFSQALPLHYCCFVNLAIPGRYLNSYARKQQFWKYTFVASLYPKNLRGLLGQIKLKHQKMVKCFGVQLHNNKANYDILRWKRIRLKFSCMYSVVRVTTEGDFRTPNTSESFHILKYEIVKSNLSVKGHLILRWIW